MEVDFEATVFSYAPVDGCAWGFLCVLQNGLSLHGGFSPCAKVFLFFVVTLGVFN